MFEEAQLYSPVTQSDDGEVEVHLGKDHPGFNDPVYRARRNEIAARRDGMGARRAGPAGRLHRAGERDLAHRSAASCTPSTSSTPCREYLEAKERARPARGPRAAARRGDRPPRAADRLPLRPGAGARAAARVLRVARRPRVPLHPVRPPPVRAALHARARRDPRGHRPRQHAGLARASPRSSSAAGRGRAAASRPTRPCR